MAQKRSASSARAKRPVRSVQHMPDSQIDFSDIPKMSDEELSQGRRVGRPKKDYAKQLIAIRLDPRLLTKLRRLATRRKKPYQTILHELLEEAVDSAARHV